MSVLKKFIDHATQPEIAELASRAGTSQHYLVHQLGGERRGASAKLAGNIEKGSRVIAGRSRGRLPVIPRTDLCEACAACPYAKACISNKQD